MNQVAQIGYNLKLPENEKICVVCGANFRRRGEKKFTAKFCSVFCKGKYQKGKPIERKMGKAKKTKCKICEAEISFRLKYCSRKCFFKGIKGWNAREKHPMWKGGIKPENQRLRTSRRYKRWREKVFRRDDFTCQICGTKGGQLEADHINSWAKYPKERFIVKNGRTLCKKCHKQTPNYKRGEK